MKFNTQYSQSFVEVEEDENGSPLVPFELTSDVFM